MNILPDELILEIFNHILLITDKRQFLKTCNHYNNLTKQSFLEYESNYRIEDFEKITDYSVEKFTIELCHDGYFEMIPDHYIILENYMMIKSASYFGTIKLLELCKLKGFNLNFVCEWATLSGNLSVFKWTLLNGCVGDNKSRVCEFAAFNGRLSVLQWARLNGFTWDSYTCSYAAFNGHLSVLQWARANGCEWNPDTCSSAAENGHLSVLQWARANGCEWNPDTCSSAAENGHLSVLQWARANGCSWDNKTCAYAKKNNHPELLKWALENGCPE